jgi:hypothetical protein
MEVGTTPLRWHNVQKQPKQREERAERTRVTFIEYSSQPKKRDIRTAGELKCVLSDISCNPTEDVPFGLFLVEDLSRDVVEMLGSKFDIDPLFFREQIVDYSWFNTRDPWAMAPSLMASMRHRDWFRIRNVRLRYFTSNRSFHNAQLESRTFNVQRRPDDDENTWLYMDKVGATVAMTRTKTSIWIGNNGPNGRGTIGIVLLDPTVREGTPLWYGHTNWLPVPSMNGQGSPEMPPDTLFEQIVRATATYPWFPSPPTASPQDVFVNPTLFTLSAEWLVVCEYIKTRLGQLEYELEKPAIFSSKGDMFQTSLARLQVWRRAVPVFREMVTETIEHALPAASRLTALGPGAASSVDDIAPDFKRIFYALSELQSRADNMTSVIMSKMSIEDTRRGLTESHSLARLTWLATIFIPLSWVTGLFSMTDDLATMKETFGWYFAAALPLTAFCLVFAWSASNGWFGLGAFKRQRTQVAS